MEPSLLPLPINLDAATLMALWFYFMLTLAAGYGVILYYHWQTYSVEPKATLITYLLFIGIVLPLLTTMGIIVFVIT